MNFSKRSANTFYYNLSPVVRVSFLTRTGGTVVKSINPSDHSSDGGFYVTSDPRSFFELALLRKASHELCALRVSGRGDLALFRLGRKFPNDLNKITSKPWSKRRREAEVVFSTIDLILAQ